jgi:hypothetical protein
MIKARVSYDARPAGRAKHLCVSLGDQYGLTADVAHDVLLVALTAATKPVVVDREGRMYRVPRTRLRQVVVWCETDD